MPTDKSKRQTTQLAKIGESRLSFMGFIASLDTFFHALPLTLMCLPKADMRLKHDYTKSRLYILRWRVLVEPCFHGLVD
jgi:hypothetical protein|nr:MAG TPA: hypothetical protein [Caudoviricetes sp.]